MCPWQQSEGDVTSDIGDSNSRAGPREVDPRQHTSYQYHEGSMRAICIAHSGVTQVKNCWKCKGP